MFSSVELFEQALLSPSVSIRTYENRVQHYKFSAGTLVFDGSSLTA